MRFLSYFNTAVKIISLYDGSMPLASFLKQYFYENKKHGSTDRKFITHACYNYYRPGFALKNISIEERLKAALFLCNSNAGDWSVLYDTDWIEHWNIQLRKRIFYIQSLYDFSFEDIFPFIDELSETIDLEHFILSHLIQPGFFLRIRNHQHEKVYHALHQHHIAFEKINDDSIALQNAIKANSIIKLDEEAIVQDFSSQRIKEFLEAYKSEIKNLKSGIDVWDCCAGSGGKSILAYDVLENINLTVSDVRASIIQNLKQRFLKAGIKKYKAIVANIADPGFISHHSSLITHNTLFDLIICDAPCTGSGTWGRTPEQLYFFQADKTEAYSSLQKKITNAAVKHLKQNAYFLYITCSVFKKENEDIIEYLMHQNKLTLIKMELLAGYDKKADTMFAALLKSG